MLQGKMFGIVAEYSTSKGIKKSIITFDCVAEKPIDVWAVGLKLAFEHEGGSDLLVGVRMIPSDSYIDLILHSGSEVKDNV